MKPCICSQDPPGCNPGGFLHSGGAGGAQSGRCQQGALPDLPTRGLGDGHGSCTALADHQLLLLL